MDRHQTVPQVCLARHPSIPGILNLFALVFPFSIAYESFLTFFSWVVMEKDLLGVKLTGLLDVGFVVSCVQSFFLMGLLLQK